MAYLLILLGVFTRIATHFHDFAPIALFVKFMPHIPNFAPIAAIALFGGVYLNKKYAIIIPIIAMLISDYFIGFYNPAVLVSVYGSFILIGLIGLWLKNHKTLPNIIGGSLFGSIIFFLVTNFAMWAKPISLYPHTMQGLLDCYIMGLPFFRNTIAGDLFYVGAFFGVMEVAIYANKKYLIKKSASVLA
ncbi:TPA: hypothetical protein DD449_00125 [Candidatus Berkelbacteria bacterium]|uniref:Uncharacterized protein n=1 Tax=Berkelbacteria bacterium GW2011_GWE1_39_12 TaxID=1618337 RepID=A0A0G4B4B4_9BACT|nr:MAG: hypothetical protein UT28_C0001G0013 [Berkelbacteria bacterium GW2011_GWE1_39_12]HBO60080.1 hypothetical protein [Candidatus Berkelbacteria bacterium]